MTNYFLYSEQLRKRSVVTDTCCFAFTPRILSLHGSQTVRRDALVHRFNFPRASLKSKLSTVLFNESIRGQIIAIL